MSFYVLILCLSVLHLNTYSYMTLYILKHKSRSWRSGMHFYKEPTTLPSVTTSAVTAAPSASKGEGLHSWKKIFQNTHEKKLKLWGAKCKPHTPVNFNSQLNGEWSKGCKAKHFSNFRGILPKKIIWDQIEKVSKHKGCKVSITLSFTIYYCILLLAFYDDFLSFGIFLVVFCYFNINYFNFDQLEV